MDKYLLFFDIDGTLLDDKEAVVPESAKEALINARQNGHEIFLCTGRCRAIWPQEILDIGFDGMVGGCGTHIIYHDEELVHNTLSPELGKSIAEDVMRYHIDGVLEGAVFTYFRPDPWISNVLRIRKENSFYGDKAVQTIGESDKYEFDKMALWFDETSDMASFKEKYQDRFDFIVRDPNFYEIVPKECSKATGIQYFCDYLGISKEFTMGFGDSTNDLPMLNHVGISVAMGDGNPDIFDSVDYVTDPVMKDGIKNALIKYGVI
ncbi:MAG: Cof-type HAD-IIB family hydrolase [Eubacterium sp.]|nr:Cof-type HAD-IIB family hydrolase [Eubacterium sp.]